VLRDAAEHSAQPADPVHGRAVLHPAVRQPIPGRPAHLLDDDQPLDGRAGDHHPADGAQAGTAAEALLAHPAERGNGGDRRSRALARACSCRRGRCSFRLERAAPCEAEEEARRPAVSEGETGREQRVEATGETVGEAKWQALRELERITPGLDKSAVRFEVVSEGERGLLGVGYAPARVVATVDAAAAPAPTALVAVDE